MIARWGYERAPRPRAATGAVMESVVFLRHFERFRGGHLKVFHYFEHVRSSPSYRALIRFTEDSVWGPANPWWRFPDAVLPAGDAPSGT